MYQGDLSLFHVRHKLFIDIVSVDITQANRQYETVYQTLIGHLISQ